MATQLSTGNHAATASPESGSPLRFPERSQSLDDVRARLSQVLHTSLDLNLILELFLEHVQPLVAIQGLYYEYPSQACQCLIGREGVHRISYRLQADKDELGELVFSRSRRFRDSELADLEAVLSTLLFPLKNALLYRHAVRASLRDSLTHTGNRIALEQALERELHLAERHQQDLSLLALDIDHFKKVNDGYGHASGDDVLREVASNIKAITRQTDLIFRYGGEEFVVLLNKTDARGAAVIAERMRRFIEQLRIETHQQQIAVTVSIGCATLTAGESGQQLFRRADQALYVAKNNGRNRIETAHSKTPDSVEAKAEPSPD